MKESDVAARYGRVVSMVAPFFELVLLWGRFHGAASTSSAGSSVKLVKWLVPPLIISTW